MRFRGWQAKLVDGGCEEWVVLGEVQLMTLGIQSLINTGRGVFEGNSMTLWLA